MLVKLSRIMNRTLGRDSVSSETVAAGRLQDAGLIRYMRGHIAILDRKGLEAAVCECYPVVKAELERLSSA